MELNKRQLERFWDWVLEDTGDYCCTEVRIYRVDQKRLTVWYRCPVCHDRWSVKCPDEVIEFDPSDVLYERYKDREVLRSNE